MDYTQLKSDVVVYTKDPLTSVIDALVRVAEYQLVRDVPSRVLDAVHSFTSGVNEREFALPSDFRKQKELRLTSFTRPISLIYLLPQKMQYAGYSGQPRYYTVDATNIVMDQTTDAPYDFELYYTKSLDLVSTGTNSLLEAYPDLYLSAVLLEVGQYRRDARFLTTWSARYETALNSVISEISQEEDKSTMDVDMRSDRVSYYADFLSGR